LAAVREPGGSIEPAQMLSAGPAFGPDLAVDARGDVVAVWQRGNDPARSSVEWSVLDHGAPALSAPRLPARAVAGRPADFAVTAVDTWPGVSVSWTFDDGATATGAQVAHVFAAPGEHRIAVSATDPSGNQARDSAVVTVAPRPPRIVSFKLRPTRFVARTSGPAIRSRPGGTRLLLSASGADTIRFTVRRRITARRWRTLRGSFSFRASDRKHRWFSGRVGGRTLRPGSYRLIAVAANREGQRSRAVERAFRILPR
jgi:PKD domain-containing protein